MSTAQRAVGWVTINETICGKLLTGVLFPLVEVSQNIFLEFLPEIFAAQNRT